MQLQMVSGLEAYVHGSIDGTLIGLKDATH